MVIRQQQREEDYRRKKLDQIKDPKIAVRVRFCFRAQIILNSIFFPEEMIRIELMQPKFFLIIELFSGLVIDDVKEVLLREPLTFAT